MQKKCFVIMSFGDEYDRVYHQGIKPALEEECGYTCVRADDDPGPAHIPAEIIRHIISADVVVADISENSPNVFYELGVSHCVGNKTITITSKVEELPFDISVFRAISYSMERDALQLLSFRLVRAVRDLESGGMELPNNLAQEAGRDYFDLRKKICENLEAIAEERRRTKVFAQFIGRKGELQDNTPVADKVVEQVLARFRPGTAGCLLVSIAGSGAIGKSTFAELVAERIRTLHKNKYSVDILPTDSYMLARSERTLRNIIGNQPESYDLDQLAKDAEALVNGEEVYVTPYDHGTGKHLPPKKVVPSDILILEGIYSFYPLIAPLNKGLRYYIFADKHQAKELKFIADFTERGYDVQTAFANADAEYNTYEAHILPFLKLADYVIKLDQYWKYDGPFPQKYPMQRPFIV